jgi:hypothetical protein
MERMSNHPIYACPRLAEAYLRSGLAKTMMEMLMYLQRSLEAAAYNLGLQGPKTSELFGVDLLQTLTRNGVVPRCPKGMKPRYYSDVGEGKHEMVKEEDAFVLGSDGKLELASHISSKYDCVPRVTLGEIKAGSGADAFKFAPVIGSGRNVLPAAINPRPTATEIRRKLKLSGGFHVAPVAVDRLYGNDQQIGAYVQPVDAMEVSATGPPPVVGGVEPMEVV